MSEGAIPWFRFYPADFMHGVRGMSATEVGLYQMLLCRIYEENGPVEYSPLRLSTYAGMREATFIKTFEKLVALGKLTLADGMVSNARAEIEISNRADDLKNSSKAGKASAQKRQQKQRQDATPVQQAFNHTDTDTDTDKEEEGGGSAGEDQISDFHNRLQSIVPGLCAAEGLAEADRWLSLPGITPAEALASVEDQITTAPNEIRVMGYFTPGIQRLSGLLSAPPLSPSAPTPTKASARPVRDYGAIMQNALKRLNEDGSLPQ